MKRLFTITPIILTVILLGIGSYFFFRETTNVESIKKTFKEITMKESSSDPSTDTEGNDTIDNTVIGVNTSNEEWPTEISSDIPKFQHGDIDTVSKITNDYINSWAITYENISEDDFEQYKKNLEENDFKTITSLGTNEVLIITVNKSPFTIVVRYIKGTDTLSISVSESLE
jgi:hypothetical protein